LVLREAFALASLATLDDLDDAAFRIAAEHPKATPHTLVASSTHSLIQRVAEPTPSGPPPARRAGPFDAICQYFSISANYLF
jgi:hypothetical protein